MEVDVRCLPGNCVNAFFIFSLGEDVSQSLFKVSFQNIIGGVFFNNEAKDLTPGVRMVRGELWPDKIALTPHAMSPVQVHSIFFFGGPLFLACLPFMFIVSDYLNL